jgi:hypothetical protein
MRSPVITAMVFLSLLAPASGQSRRQTSADTSGKFVIDRDRPYVYLRFDHIGTGVPFSADEPPKRVWLWFVNNCRVAVLLRTFGVPHGSPEGEVGVIHDVVNDRRTATTGSKSSSMPIGYASEVSSSESVQPGQSILFSVPVIHLSKDWHIEIPYQFDLPPGKGPREPIVGGEPRMVLLYSAWDLPEKVQRQLGISR